MNDTAQLPVQSVPQSVSLPTQQPVVSSQQPPLSQPLQSQPASNQQPNSQVLPGPQPHPHIPSMTPPAPTTPIALQQMADPAISLPHKEYAPQPIEIPLQDVMEVHREPELAPALLEVGVEHSPDVQAEQSLSQSVSESEIEFSKESVPHPPHIGSPSLPPLPKSRQELEEEVKVLPTTSSAFWKAVLVLKLWKERILPKSTI